jgi:hypothetical protein
MDVDQTGGEESAAKILAPGGWDGLDRGDPLALDHERSGADMAVGMENAAAVEAHALALIDQIGCRP